MDFDGDGKTDILSGSWPGELYLFRRGPDGKFLAGEKIKDASGKEIKIESASVPFMADWNGDGLLDLIVGDVQGAVHYLRNEGTATKPSFGSPLKLEADGKPIQVGGGDSGPAVADWDGDKIPDLLVGCGDGSVLWYRNVGTAKEPKLGPAKTLVKAAPTNEVWSGGLKENQCGARVKICVADFNGDGKLDLLLGDLSVSMGEKPKLSKEDQEAVDKAQKRQNEIMKDYGPSSTEFSKLYQQNQSGGSAEAKKEFMKAYSDAYQASASAANFADAPANETADAKKSREANLKQAQEKMDKHLAEMVAFDKAPANETPEAKKQRETKLKEALAKYFKLQSEMSKLYTTIAKGQAKRNYHGHIWVCLRQGNVAAKP